MTSQYDAWRQLGQQLRVDSIRSSSAAGSGHPTSSMSAADLMAVLMSRYLHYDFGNPVLMAQIEESSANRNALIGQNDIALITSCRNEADEGKTILITPAAQLRERCRPAPRTIDHDATPKRIFID